MLENITFYYIGIAHDMPSPHKHQVTRTSMSVILESQPVASVQRVKRYEFIKGLARPTSKRSPAGNLSPPNVDLDYVFPTLKPKTASQISSSSTRSREDARIKIICTNASSLRKNIQ